MTKLTDKEREIALQYGHLFHNTGGNDPIELMERDGVNYFNNPIVAELQGSCHSQVLLLLKLKKLGLLARAPTTKAKDGAVTIELMRHPDSGEMVRAPVNRYCGATMCLDTDDKHEPTCPKA